MPHFIIEYSANLDSHIDVAGLVEAVHEAAIETGIFPLKGLRTRASPRRTYRIADAHPDNAFIHITARIGHGRSVEVRRAAGKAVFEVACEFLRLYSEANPLALSFEMEQIDPDTSFKYNNIPQWIAHRDGAGAV
ncbi:MAG: 5-carboxymethyl-2-hydroxymuconate Delta-isomerase [Gammaproteobacteria bacterium]|jgi:5-carboxymethyl-2-hydroxymuconate isomerase